MDIRYPTVSTLSREDRDYYTKEGKNSGVVSFGEVLQYVLREYYFKEKVYKNKNGVMSILYKIAPQFVNEINIFGMMYDIGLGDLLESNDFPDVGNIEFCRRQLLEVFGENQVDNMLKAVIGSQEKYEQKNVAEKHKQSNIVEKSTTNSLGDSDKEKNRHTRFIILEVGIFAVTVVIAIIVSVKIMKTRGSLDESTPSTEQISATTTEEKVTTEDPQKETYETACESYSAGDYETAQSLYMEIEDYSDSKNYLNKIGAYYYKQLDSLYKDGKYDELVDIIEKCDEKAEYPDGYQKTIKKKDKYKSEFAEKIENEAANLLYSEGYDSFEKYVTDSENGLFDSTAANAIIEAYKPVYMSSLTPYDEGEWQQADKIADSGWSNRELEFEDGVYDDAGNVHNNCLVGGGCSLAYHIGGKYSLLTGTLFVQQDNQATNDSPVFLLIRDGDGNDLYRDTLVSGYESKYFSIDVSGIEDIVIYFDGFSGGFLDSYYYGGVGEMALIK